MPNSKDYTHPYIHTFTQLVELINKFNKVVGHKVKNKMQLYYYTLTKNNLKRKLRKQFQAGGPKMAEE